MTAHLTYILSCEGVGCFALFGHLHTDRKAGEIRNKAVAAGWVCGTTPRKYARRHNQAGLMIEEIQVPRDLCPECAKT